MFAPSGREEGQRRALLFLCPWDAAAAEPVCPCALGGVAEAWLDGLSPTRSPLAAQRGLAGLLGGVGMLRSDRAPMGRDHTTVAVCSGLHLPAGLSRGACSSGSASSSGLRELAAHPPDAHSACENA